MVVKPVVQKLLRILGWITLGIIFLIVLVFILIQVPAVQNFAKNKIVTYLQEKIKTKVSIAELSIAFPKQVVLKGVYFEDQRNDTLLAGKEIRVDIALFALLNNEVNVDYLELNGVRANVYRESPDTAFNYQYIVNAFADDQKTPSSNDATNALKFHLDRIVLKNILATFKDDETGSDVYLDLGNFETRIKDFDPGNMVYNISKISLSNITAKIDQHKPVVATAAATTEVDTTTVVYPQVQLGELSFQNISLNYKDDVSALAADVNIGELITHPKNLDLKSTLIQLNDLQLKSTIARIVLGKSQTSDAANDTVAKVAQQTATNGWKIQIAKTGFENDALVYDDNTKPRIEGLDYNHLNIQGFIFNADNLMFTPVTYSGTINELAFHDQSGLNLKKFHTNFLYNDTSASLQNLLLQTDNSSIKDAIAIHYPSLEHISKDPGQIFVDAHLSNSAIAVKDILFFMPGFKRSVKGHEQSVIRLNSTVKGYVRDLSVPELEMTGYGNTYVKLSGNIKGLPDTKNTYYNISLTRLSSTRNDVLALLPANTLAASVRLPDIFSITGFFNGSMNAFSTKLGVRTNRGDVNLDGKMTANKSYAIKATLNNVDAGYLAKQDTLLGKVTMTATIKGSGLDPKTAVFNYDVDVASAELRGYNYNHLVLKGASNKGIVHATANINDKNINLNLDATADINPKYPSLQMDLMIDTLNLSALHIITDSLTALHGHIVANMQNTDPDSLDGTLTINNLVVTRGSQTLSEDSLALVATTSPQQSIVVNSDILKASLTGEYKLTEFAQSLQQTINKYYKLPGFKEENIAAQNWQLNATIIPTGLLLQLMPGMRGSDSAIINASFNSTANDLNVALRNRHLVFNGQQVDSLNFTAETNANQLDYALTIDGANAGSMRVYKTSLAGFVANDQLDFGLRVNDSKEKTKYMLAGLLSQPADAVKLSLKPDSVILDYTKWVGGANNFIQYDSTGILVNNFSLSNADQSISINSTSQTSNAPIKVDFKNFRIATITAIANQDSLMLDAVINGNAVITDPVKNPVFTSDLHIDNLVYQRDTIGNLALQVNNKTANTFTANVALTGNNNDIKLDGMYYTGEGKMDLHLNLNQVYLPSFKGLAAGQIKDMTGSLKGNVNISGTTTQPAVNGNLHFENASITPAVSGAKFVLPNDNIAIDSRGVHFGYFNLLDSAGNKALLSGDVLTNDFKNFSFNTDFDAENFTVVNTPKTTNQMFYGKLNIDTHIKMRGEMTSPTINAFLRINKETDFAVILPGEDPEVVDREGVVRFVDKDHPGDTANTHASAIDTAALKHSDLRGLDVSVGIETDSSAQFTLVVDERNGDALTLKGTADLTGGIDKSGKISLTGTEQLVSGSYNLSMSLLNRKFDIQRGSTITWTGDPTTATINVTATYLANTASIDLVEQQLGARSDADINKFKQKLPFQVNLIMSGELLKPVVAFDITLPQNILNQWPEVNARLTQIRSESSELNKQVFALLLLGRFVGENPLQSSAGGSTSDVVRESASRLLTDQLNQLAGNLIQGVDINFALTSETDYSTGAAANLTQLNVGVSKKLMNDRLKVNVGSNFELEGPQNSNRSASNLAGDVSVDYQVTRDGRYALRIYRRNQYEGIIEGQVIETGATFMLSFDYDKLSELFKGRKEKKAIQQQPLQNKQSTSK